MTRVPDRLRAVPPAHVGVALLAGAVGVVASYALVGLTPDFVAAPIANTAARRLPGPVVTLAILTLGSLGQQLNLVVAVLAAALLLAAGAGLGLAATRRVDDPLAGVAVAAAAAWIIAAALTGNPVAAVGVAAAVGLVVGLWSLRPDTENAEDASRPDPARRRLVAGLAGLVGLGAIGTWLQTRGDRSILGAAARTPTPEVTVRPDIEAPTPPGASAPAATPADSTETRVAGGGGLEDTEAIGALLREADGKSLGVDGIEPLVSEDFYTVDINSVDPVEAAADWRLTVNGEVDREVAVDYDDLTAAPAEHRFVSLRCVGESLNGHKLDNALWTGIPIGDLVRSAGPRGGCECVTVHAADGYFVTFPLEAVERGFLAYGMNGQPLPRSHGAPVRLLVPGHWGEVNVKWITRIEVLDEMADGYWEQRGWHGTGPVSTVAKIHAVNRLGDGRVQVGGHAYAGLRGVRAVEVSVDGGDTWREATLSDRLPGDDVWRMWSLEYDAPGRRHEVVARAVEESGRVQTETKNGAFPSGATGWVRRTVRA